jgi:Domain of unknown function (DUF1707)/Domain of unknown function (DUF4190)
MSSHQRAAGTAKCSKIATRTALSIVDSAGMFPAVITLDRPPMPPDHPTHQLRASDADREAAADRLRTAAAEGRLDPYELDERLTTAYSARWCAELDRLTLDVTPPPPPAPPVAPVFVRRQTRTNGLAIASLLAGLFWMWWIGSAVAIVLGHVALRQIDRSGGLQTGRALAICGLAFGYFGAATLLAVILFALA